MAGGPTRTLARSGSERRPSRRGVNTSLELESRFGRPSGSIGFRADRLRHALADHPVRFFSALSLEKNAPSVGLCDVLGASAISVFMVSLYIDPQKCCRRKLRIDDDMAGGPTRTLARSGSERRPSRRGVNISQKSEPAWREHFT